MDAPLPSDPTVYLKFIQIERVPVALLAIIVAWLLTNASSRVLDDVGTRFTSWRILLKQVSVVIKFVLLVGTAVFVTASVVHLTDEVMLAVGGSIAVGVGFAVKDLLASFMAGVIILFDRPFQVGDRVQFGDTYGEVVEIGLRTTRIATLDDNLVSIPNSRFLTDIVASANAGALDQMCVFTFYVGTTEDFLLAKSLVYEATVASRFVFLRKPVVVHVKEAPVPGLEGRLAMHVFAKAYVMDGRFEVAFATDVHERVKAAFRERGIRTIGDFQATDDAA